MAVDGTRTARIGVTHDDTTTRVDVGQALRGHRFAHRLAPTADAATTGDVPSADVWAALSASGLLQAESGDVTLDVTGQDDVVVPALPGQRRPAFTGHRDSPSAARGNGPNRVVVGVSA
ncbi:hypothetical protein [Streptomyces endophyticus]|uniref:Uncharacterized protein n=1 Tax=Streptomyces endophyticus TaxID=714166 RepID=A0ABU6F271_9ACTN|nr:hypothetical protein [Streptomyces endophyticus]MEB8338093.1 hypothetical protein [Streptomyces endophyticus]